MSLVETGCGANAAISGLRLLMNHSNMESFRAMAKVQRKALLSRKDDRAELLGVDPSTIDRSNPKKYSADYIDIIGRTGDRAIPGGSRSALRRISTQLTIPTVVYRMRKSVLGRQ